MYKKQQQQYQHDAILLRIERMLQINTKSKSSVYSGISTNQYIYITLSDCHIYIHITYIQNVTQAVIIFNENCGNKKVNYYVLN